MYTDVRSGKVEELADNPHAELVFFDPRKLVQLRCAGSAETLTGPHAQAAFSLAPQRTYADYTSDAAPGATLSDAPEPPPPPPAADDPAAAAAANFCVLQIRVGVVDALDLRRDGHRRARLSWSGDAASAVWIAP
ncbi:MAG: pyridoxamine 5'-phosphate oxidase family protein [Pseudomonadota bacterium]